MQWVIDNWLVVLFGGAMVAMHLFGHGKHGNTSTNAKSRKTGPSPDDDKSGEPS